MINNQKEMVRNGKEISLFIFFLFFLTFPSLKCVPLAKVGLSLFLLRQAPSAVWRLVVTLVFRTAWSTNMGQERNISLSLFFWLLPFISPHSVPGAF